MRRTLRAAGAALALGALVLAMTPATAAPAPASVPERYLHQQVDWKTCFPNGVPQGLPPGSERLECGSFTVPRDWDHADAKVDLTVAVSRLRPATGTPKASLLTNPGGPGGPGRTLPLLFLVANRTRLLDNLEVVGIDVRGTGDSTNVTCQDQSFTGSTLDPRNRAAQNTDVILDGASYVAKTCQAGSGEVGPFVTTAQTVRDLDLLRALLGREKIDWLGYSGGTWLGAYYATYFPSRVGQFVLDGNTQFTAPWQVTFDGQPLGFQRRFESDFLPWAASYDNVLGLGATAAAVRALYESLRADLAAQPLNLGPFSVFATDLDYFVVRSMYSKSGFPGLAQGLGQIRALLADRSGAAKQASPSLVDSLRAARAAARYGRGMRPLSDDAFDSTFLSITCNDTPWTGDRASLVSQSDALGKAYPLLGWAHLAQPCVFWHRPALAMPTPTGQGLPPILMVANDRDPATPYEGAVAAHRAFVGSRLLTVTNEGDHTKYASDNPCVDDAVEAFLVDGVVPAGDTSCAGAPIPPPPSQGAAPAVPPRAGTPQETINHYTHIAGHLPK